MAIYLVIRGDLTYVETTCVSMVLVSKAYTILVEFKVRLTLTLNGMELHKGWGLSHVVARGWFGTPLSFLCP